MVRNYLHDNKLRVFAPRTGLDLSEGCGGLTPSAHIADPSPKFRKSD